MPGDIRTIARNGGSSDQFLPRPGARDCLLRTAEAILASFDLQKGARFVSQFAMD